MRKAVLVTVATVMAVLVSCAQPDSPKDSPTTGVGESPYFLGTDVTKTALQRILLLDQDSSGSMEKLMSNALTVCESEFGLTYDRKAILARMQMLSEAESSERLVLDQAMNDAGIKGIRINIMNGDMVYLLYLSADDGCIHAVWLSSEVSGSVILGVSS